MSLVWTGSNISNYMQYSAASAWGLGSGRGAHTVGIRYKFTNLDTQGAGRTFLNVRDNSNVNNYEWGHSAGNPVDESITRDFSTELVLSGVSFSTTVWSAAIIRFNSTWSSCAHFIRDSNGATQSATGINASASTQDASTFQRFSLGYAWRWSARPVKDIKIADVTVWNTDISDADRDDFLADTPGADVAVANLVFNLPLHSSKTDHTGSASLSLVEGGTVTLDQSDNPPAFGPVVNTAVSPVVLGSHGIVTGSNFGT